MDRTLAYIRERFRFGLSIKEIAHAVHISSRQLHRKFVEAFGTSPQTFITKLRVQAACEMLQREDSQVGEVAKAFGFCTAKFVHSALPEIRGRYSIEVPEKSPTPPPVINRSAADS